MDDVESVEPWDEELDDELEAPAPVTVRAIFKSGLSKEWVMTLPRYSTTYNSHVTRGGLLDLVTNSYALGEAPLIILPLDDDTHVFIDLSATDYLEIS
jgi:hypothetical protein